MAQPNSGRQIPVGLIITCLFPVVVVFGVYRVQHNAPWASVAYVTLATLCTYMVGRWLLGTVWGLALALMLALHPAYLFWALADSSPIEGETLKLMALVGILRVWQLILRRNNQTSRLLAVGVLLSIAGGLSWLTANAPGWGLATNLLILVGLLAALILIVQRRQEPAEEYKLIGSTVLSEDLRPPATHIPVAAGLVIVVPLLGFALALAFSQAAMWLDPQGEYFHLLVRRRLPDPNIFMRMLSNAVQLPGPTGASLETVNEEMSKWAWPWFWPNLGPGPWFAYGIFFAALLLGVFRVIWRGWLQWSRRDPPLCWTLALFALAVGAAFWLDPEHVNNTKGFPFATPTLLIPMFGIADLFTAIGDRLRLPPPEERAPATIQE
jgi:hypothetical protein